MDKIISQGGASEGLRGIDERSLFRSLFLAYPDAMLIVDAQGEILLANPAAERLLGYTMEELRALNVDALVPDSVRPSHESHRKSYANAPRARPMGMQMDLVARRKDAAEVRVEIALSPLVQEGPPLVVVAIRGIEEYPRVKQAIRRERYSEHLANFGRFAVDERASHRLLAQAPGVATMALGVEESLIVLLDGANAEATIGAHAGNAPGLDVGSTVPEDYASFARYSLASGEPVLVPNAVREVRFQFPPLLVLNGFDSALSVPLYERGRIIGVFQAFSKVRARFGEDEVKFMESLANLLATTLQRARSEEALGHAQRLESVGQLTGGIAHDFNNLLTIIQGNLQILEEMRDVRQNPYASDMLAAALRASRRGSELTGKLLAFSRRQVLLPTQVDVRAMLYSLSDMLHRTLDQRIRIEVEVPQEDLFVLADAGQLEAALLNVALNGRDAMPEGGTLVFKADVCKAMPPAARRILEEPNMLSEHFVAIAVRDSGSGMPPAVKERAFEPFFTTKTAGRGTGLGLSTVYGYIKQSNGSVTIESEPDVGTEVTLYMPRSWTPGASAATEELALDDVPAGLRVLLVEDDVNVRDVIQALLRRMGCAVVSTQTAEEALGVLLAPESQPLDLVLTDVALGAGMRGTQLAGEIGTTHPSLPILVMSGFSSDLLESGSGVLSRCIFLRKPFSPHALAQAITSALSNRNSA